jgi:hypothetical protein
MNNWGCYEENIICRVERKLSQKKVIDTAHLYESIGHPELSHDMHWANTCAVRVSIALVGAGVTISPGHMTVKAGKHMGHRLEQGQVPPVSD